MLFKCIDQRILNVLKVSTLLKCIQHSSNYSLFSTSDCAYFWKLIWYLGSRESKKDMIKVMRGRAVAG